MERDEARGRICLCCLRKAKRFDKEIVRLSENAQYLNDIYALFPDYDITFFCFQKSFVQHVLARSVKHESLQSIRCPIVFGWVHHILKTLKGVVRVNVQSRITNYAGCVRH
eukprot:TRINITY_DN8575_c0_g1_i1.p1 TRINITY_DN8575_c0_g1~~TRINITY_DN8575_c0_g1_i1.p1  ORF type:complete len:111 (+),score=5.19 TRINITY_DN8575_c0_g1_i1:237-569(+)